MSSLEPTEDELAHIAEIAAFLPPEVPSPGQNPTCLIPANEGASLIYWGSRCTPDSYKIMKYFSGLRLGYCIEPRLVRWKFGLLTPDDFMHARQQWECAKAEGLLRWPR